MKNEEIRNQSTVIGILLCVFFIVSIIIFPMFGFDLDFLFSSSFPIIVFFPIFFIGIFIPIITVLGSNRQRKNLSPPSTSEKPLQLKEDILRTERIPDIYCKYCGERVSRDSIYCSQCGTKLKILKY